MASKLIIFVALASLAQVSRAVSWEAAYGLSGPQQNVLVRIASDQDEAILNKRAANKPFYDALEKVAGGLILSQKPDTENILAGLGSGIGNTNEVTDFFLDTISKAVGESCSAVEDAQAPLYAISEELLTLFRDLLAKALSGDYSGNESEFDDIHEMVLAKNVQFNEIIFDALRTCLDTEDRSLLAVIKIAQDGSNGSLAGAVNSLFNAIKTVAAAVSAGNGDATLLMKIRGFQQQAFAVLADDIDYKAAILKTVLVHKSVDYTGMIYQLYEMMKTESMMLHKLNAAGDIIFGTMTEFLTINANKLYDDGDNGFSATVAAEALTLANYNDVGKILLDSILAIEPEASDEVAVTLRKLSTTGRTLTANLYKGIRIAQTGSSTLSETIRKLKDVKIALELDTRKITEIILDLIYSEQLSDASSNYERAIPQAIAVSLLRYLEGIYNGMVVLAEAKHASEVSEYKFDQIESAKGSAGREIHSYVWATAIARAIKLSNEREG